MPYAVGYWLLMVSTLKTLSSKMLARDPRKTSHLRTKSPTEALLKFAPLLAVAVASYLAPWKMLLGMMGMYMISLIIGPLAYVYLAQ